jgi:phage shock protein A
MGLLSRASTIFKAKVSKALDTMEDPRETLDYSYERQQELLQKVKRGLADIVTARKGLELQKAQVEATRDRLEQEAAAAVRQGRDDLAQQALERKAEAQSQVDALDKQIDGLKAEEAKMVDTERRLSLKIQSFRAQKEVIKAQYSSAEAQVKIGEAATGIGEEMADVGLAVDRAKDRTAQMQARAAAINDLSQSGVLEDVMGSDGDAVDRDLGATQRKDQVAADLARLKAQVAQGGGGTGA